MKKLNSKEFNKKFWETALKREEFNKAFVSAIARNYDLNPLKSNGKTYELNELNFTYKNTLNENLKNISDEIDTSINLLHNSLQAEEERVEVATNKIRENLNELDLFVKKLKQENDDATNEYLLSLDEFTKTKYLNELFCTNEADEKKRNEYLAIFDSLKQERINKIKQMQESPEGIAQIEAEYIIKAHEIKEKYTLLLRNDVANLVQANKYFEEIGFDLAKKYKLDGDNLSKEFNNFKENIYDVNAPILKKKIIEAQERLHNISFDDLAKENAMLLDINKAIEAIKAENEIFNNYTNENYLKYLEKNKKDLKSELITEAIIKNNKTKVINLNNKISTLEKKESEYLNDIKLYNDRDERFDIFKANAYKNINLYKKIKDLTNEKADEFLINKFLNTPIEIKISKKYEEAIVSLDKTENEITSIKNELETTIKNISDIEINNSTINEQLNQYSITINNMKEVIKKQAILNSHLEEIKKYQDLAARLNDIINSCKIILDVKTADKEKMNAFTSMALKYLSVTEGKYQVNSNENQELLINNTKYYPIAEAFLEYQRKANLDSYTIDFSNPNKELLNKAGIIAMYNSASSSLNEVTNKISSFNVNIYNPLDTFKENRLKEQKKLEAKAVAISNKYRINKEEFDNITKEIAKYSEELANLEDELDSFKEKLAINIKGFNESKMKFLKYRDENLALFNAKNDLRKASEENIRELKNKYANELKVLDESYSLLRKQALQKNNELISEVDNDGILKIEADDEKIMYVKNIEAKMMCGKSQNELANMLQNLKNKANELEIKKDKTLIKNKQKLAEIENIKKDLNNDLTKLKGPESSYLLALNKYNNELKLKDTYINSLNQTVKENLKYHHDLSPLQKCAVDYYYDVPTSDEFNLPEEIYTNSDKKKEYINSLNQKLKESFGEYELIDLLSNDASFSKIARALKLLTEIDKEKELYYNQQLNSINRDSLVEKEISFSKYSKEGHENYFFGNNTLLRDDINKNHLVLRGSAQYKALENSLNELSNPNISMLDRLHNVSNCAKAYLDYKNVNDTMNISNNTRGRVLFALNLVARINAYDKASKNKQSLLVNELAPSHNRSTSNNLENGLAKEKIKER